MKNIVAPKSNFAMDIKHKFQNVLQMEFINYCDRKRIEPSSDTLMAFLTSHNFINPTIMKRFVILKEFDKRLDDHNHHKTRTIDAIATDFKMDESSIRNIIKNHSLDFIGS